jgi:predicted transcriptional regulator of viral defense system
MGIWTKNRNTYCLLLVTKKGKKERKIGQMLYKSVSLGKRAVGAHYLDKYFISTRAKTIFDCLYLPKYAGGYSQILYAIKSASLNKQEWNELLDYLIELGTNSTLQRTGYLLSVMKKKYPDSIPEKIFQDIIKKLKNELKKRNKSIVVLDPTFLRGGKFIREWGIYDNVGL